MYRQAQSRFQSVDFSFLFDFCQGLKNFWNSEFVQSNFSSSKILNPYFCTCRIQMVKLYIQLYQNSAGRPNIATDFQQIYDLLLEWKKQNDFQGVFKRHDEHKMVFANMKLEIDTLDYIFQAAKG